MGEYWFYIKPYCFVWNKGKTVLVYDSHSGKGIELKSNRKIKWLINQLNDLSNLYCIELPGSLLEENELGIFISTIQDFGSGSIIPIVNGRRKPAFLVPILNLQQDIKKLRKEPERSIGNDIMKNLHEVSFFINIGKPQKNSCLNVYMHFFNHNLFNRDLRFSEIKNFLHQLSSGSINSININADNFFKYPELGPLINELDKMHILKTFCLPLRNFPINISELEFLESSQFRLKILVDPNFNPRLVINVLKKLKRTNIQNEWVFVVSSRQQFSKVNSIILKSHLDNAEIKPFFNGRNMKFFKENIFLTKEDLLNSGLNKREIFAHQVLNTNDFGKLTILPDGKVYANVNFPALGHIHDPVKKMIFDEMDKGKSWRRIRDMEPCNKCVYQWLCPSPSDYEIAIGKPNLCHVM